jgi:hypothetical protein
VEGVILPNIPLSNIEIDDAVKQLQIPNFRGCYCINMLSQLPHMVPAGCERSECGIQNLDNSTGDGTHWTARFRNNYTSLTSSSRPVQPRPRIYTSIVMVYNRLSK